MRGRLLPRIYFFVTDDHIRAGEYGYAYVKGLQDEKVCAMVKHYVSGYSVSATTKLRH